MTLNNCCVVGMIKLVLYDNRDNSNTKGELMELFIGEDNYKLVQHHLELQMVIRPTVTKWQYLRIVQLYLMIKTN